MENRVIVKVIGMSYVPQPVVWRSLSYEILPRPTWWSVLTLWYGPRLLCKACLPAATVINTVVDLTPERDQESWRWAESIVWAHGTKWREPLVGWGGTTHFITVVRIVYSWKLISSETFSLLLFNYRRVTDFRKQSHRRGVERGPLCV